MAFSVPELLQCLFSVSGPSRGNVSTRKVLLVHLTAEGLTQPHSKVATWVLTISCYSPVNLRHNPSLHKQIKNLVICPETCQRMCCFHGGHAAEDSQLRLAPPALGALAHYIVSRDLLP